MDITITRFENFKFTANVSLTSPGTSLIQDFLISGSLSVEEIPELAAFMAKVTERLKRKFGKSLA